MTLKKRIKDSELIFRPEISPKDMLEAGVFGGNYFKGDISEYPKNWFKKAKINDFEYDVDLNYFKVKSGLSYDEWLKRGWIFKQDPLGWFQWYCRYTMGRRIPDIDKIQIKRWKCFGPRHIGAIKRNCMKNDIGCRRRQRQALLQWGYNPFI